MIVECLPSSPVDILPKRKPLSTSKPDFTSLEPLTFLYKCKSFKQFKQIHAKIIRFGLNHHHLTAVKMLRLCSSFGELDYATAVFHQIQNPSTFLWNLLIRAYVMNNCSRGAILLYNSMLCDGVGVDKFTFPFVMKACLACSCVEKAKEVYGFAVKTGFCGDVYLNNVLMDLYFKCGVVDDGVKVFDKMSGRNVVSWTTMISGLLRNGRLGVAGEMFEKMPVKNVVAWTAMINAHSRSEKPERAFALFAEMQSDGVKPNQHTLVGLLVACSELGSLELGRWVHNFALENGFQISVYLGTAMIDMYSKCGHLECAKEVFDSMESKSVATWNVMITSLGVHGRSLQALAVFEEMERMNVKPDEITMMGVLCAILHMGDVEEAQKYYYYMTERYDLKLRTESHDILFEMCSRAAMLLDEAQ